jgi:carboxyl-terminal processing protease
VYIADSDGIRDLFEADGTALAPDVPLTLLVNKGTASASEVWWCKLKPVWKARGCSA